MSRHQSHHDRMGSWHRAASAQEVVGSWRPPKLLRRDASTNRLGSKSVRWLCQAWPLAHDHMAGSHGEKSVLAIWPVCGSCRASGLLARRQSAEEWLLIEWPDGEEEPIKILVSTLPEDARSVSSSTLPSCDGGSNRDYQELKQEVGLGHFEDGEGGGFHHHATLCIAGYGFLISERETIPPQQIVPPGCSRNLPYAKVTSPEHPPLRPERHVPTRLQQCDGRLVASSHDAIALPMLPARTDTEICDTVRLNGFEQFGLTSGRAMSWRPRTSSDCRRRGW